MKGRRRLLIQENWEERNIKFKHRKTKGNPVVDALYSSKKVLTYLGIVFILGGCIYALFDFSLQKRIVTAIESIFF